MSSSSRVVVAALLSATLLLAQDWRPCFPTNDPGTRNGVRMAFDGARGEAVLFGGQLPTAQVTADTFTYNGTTWTRRQPANAPIARLNHEMVYDSVRQRVVLFGGQQGATVLADTWEWDGVNWTQISSTNAPSIRGSSVLVYDPVGNRYLLWGGVNSFFQQLEDTWSFANGQWTQLPTTRSPSSRSRGGAVWFTPQQRLLIHGGGYVQSFHLRSTPMWEFGANLASFVTFEPSVCPTLDPPVLKGASQPLVGGTFRATIESFSWVHGFVIFGFSTTDGCVEVAKAYYAAPPGWIHRDVHVQWDTRSVRIIDLETGALLREHLRTQDSHFCVPPQDRSPRTPPQIEQLATATRKGIPAAA